MDPTLGTSPPRPLTPKAARRALAEGGLWTWQQPTPTGDPSVQRVELPVGDATLALSLDEIRTAIAALTRP